MTSPYKLVCGLRSPHVKNRVKSMVTSHQKLALDQWSPYVRNHGHLTLLGSARSMVISCQKLGEVIGHLTVWNANHVIGSLHPATSTDMPIVSEFLREGAQVAWIWA